jgi:hypothetical protein
MSNPAAAHIKSICSSLNEHSVEYLLVGGTAMAFYGAYRMTTKPSGELADKYDFDFWYNPTYANFYKLLKALAALGFDVKKHFDENTPKPRESYFKYESEYFTLDFLPEILGHSDFDVAYKRKQTRKLDEIRIYIISNKDLYIAKRASLRQKDKDDIDFMKSRGIVE